MSVCWNECNNDYRKPKFLHNTEKCDQMARLFVQFSAIYHNKICLLAKNAKLGQVTGIDNSAKLQIM